MNFIFKAIIAVIIGIAVFHIYKKTFLNTASSVVSTASTVVDTASKVIDSTQKAIEEAQEREQHEK